MQQDRFATSMVGTTQYMPPEQLNNQEYNHKVDIWSFGVLIYQLMAFEYPFNKKTERAELGALRAMTKKYRPLPDTYSIALRNLVAKLLIKDQLDERIKVINDEIEKLKLEDQKLWDRQPE